MRAMYQAVVELLLLLHVRLCHQHRLQLDNISPLREIAFNRLRTVAELAMELRKAVGRRLVVEREYAQYGAVLYLHVLLA